MAKALARAGVASRREVERYIEAGRVAINGRVLTTPAVKVLDGDILTVDGMVVASAEPTRLWRYHKPNGLMTTHNDPQGRPTVFEHLPEGLPRVISIGRLDLNSEGLLLLTNDGELSRSLELPATGWVRRYRARAFGHTTQARLDKLKDGVTIEGVAYGPIEAKLDKVQGADRDNEKAAANLWITVSLSEGKNREVRRVLEHLGVKVNRLIRLAYGPFALGTLEVGAVEEVGPRVIREQLSAHIAPENLPTGDRRPGPPMASTPGPGRRSSGGGPKPAGGDAPRAKAAAPEPEKKEYKPGWAKPKAKSNVHAVAGAANAKAKKKAKPSGERQSWGETSAYKPKVRPSGAPAARVAVGERPAYGEPRPGGKFDKAAPRPAWAKDTAAAPRTDKAYPDKRGAEATGERPAWAKSGGKARTSTNPDGSRAARRSAKTAAGPEAPKSAKPAWTRDAPGVRPEKPQHPKAGFRSSGRPQGANKLDRPRPEGKERPAFGGSPGGSRPRPPPGRVYGLPQHGEAHERAPWDAAKPEGKAPGPRPPRKGPPKPRKPR